MREMLTGGKRVFRVWLALISLLMIGSAQARTLSAEIAHIDAGPVQAETVVISVAWPADAVQGELTLSAARVDMAMLGYSLRQLRWRCPLQQGDSGWSCEGPAEAAGWRRGTLRLQLDDARQELSLRRAGAQLRLRHRNDRDALTIDATTLPVAWLQPLLDQVWAAAGLSAGTLDADFTLAFNAADTRLDGRIAATALGFDTPDGRIAAEALGGSGPLSMRWQGDSLAINTELVLRGGQVLIDPLYMELPASNVGVMINAVRDGAGNWQLPQFHWRDPGTLMLKGTAQLRPQAGQDLHTLDITAEVADLERAHARYFDAVLGAIGGTGLAPSGALTTDITLAPESGGWRVEADLDDVTLRDARGRFELDGADGRLGWTSQATEIGSDIGWRAAALFGITLGPTRLALASADSGLRLRAPLRVDALGGALLLQRLAWKPAVGTASPQFDMGLELIELDMAALSERFGWPAFTGRLGGVIPAVNYEDGVLRFDGGLEVALFDGRVDVVALRLERPFGVAPRLQADIDIEQLNLQPLTSVFGFGEITGRLNGKIAGLQLLDWEPVAFDAVLRTSTTAPGPRRISQRAVNDLTAIGGGGIAGGLQASMLRMFDSFSYAQIGLSCRLVQGVCHMGGLDSSGPGYTIVEGAGLPRITVNGFQQRVDWAVLVSRLRAVAAGQALRIDTP